MKVEPWSLDRRLAFVAVASAALIGTWARVHGLGARQLAIDEYYLLVSALAILETGLPEPPGGGLYTRGLPLQLLVSAFVWLVDDPHLGLRIPTVFIGLLVPVAAFGFGRRVSGPWLGVAMGTCLLISSWHVEFSRFGRMYVDLQLFTLLYLSALIDQMRGAQGWRRRLPYLWLTLAVLTHGLGISLVPLLMVPLAHQWVAGGRARARSLVLPAVVALGLFFLWAVDLRAFGVLAPYPEGYQRTGGGPGLSLPAFPFWSVGTSLANLGLVLVLMAMMAGVALALRPHLPRLGSELPLALPMMIAAAFHQLVLAGLLALVLLVRRHRFDERSHRRAAFWLFGAAAVASFWVALAAWLTWGQGDRTWIDSVGAGSFLGGARLTFFGWPELVRSLFFTWYAAAPLLTMLLLAALAVQLVSWLRLPPTAMFQHPVLPVLCLLVFFGTFPAAYPTTRYSFYLYPLLLVLFFLTIQQVVTLIGRRVASGRPGALSPMAPVVVGLALFALAEDVNPTHLRAIASDDVSFRIGPFQGRDDMWYEREDYRSPAEFVNSQAGPRDGILVVDAPPTSFYLEGTHAVYYERGGHRFRNVSRAEGTVDYWSGQRLLSTPEEVRDWASAADRVWVIRWADALPPALDPGVVQRAESVFVGQDGRLEVLRLHLLPRDAAETP